MTIYEDRLSMAEARQRYFASNGFDGSYSDRWVKLNAGPIAVYFPNGPGRVRAVKVHDLHHVVTGYQTTWTGEAEIGAWEIASGCGRFFWAWALNVSAFAVGVVIAPRAVFRAFVRGRHTRNLYHISSQARDALLARAVGDVRRDLGLDQTPPVAQAADIAAFVTWVAAGVALSLAPWVAGVALLVRLI